MIIWLIDFYASNKFYPFSFVGEKWKDGSCIFCDGGGVILLGPLAVKILEYF